MFDMLKNYTNNNKSAAKNTSEIKRTNIKAWDSKINITDK